ncbi:hypothetical protein [Nocardia huaxiensis]|uniref:IrrE N-terminal-like domain-containing protein n=1 Tax=Nocardia huaxiensis TaxID=2755382 RepID=A0A7D6ZGZ7_9NOCA|nr:hypothetical protein [Nocardia huaxiensis]QLY30187.1 hypothetical protein H0264_34330 [Nocardia huaxiensis]UFS96198.1 hypothetical protein LPY97_37120 [Nocardia huaxiensis]
MDHRRLRRELRGLGLPGRFPVARLAEALAHRRGRPLRLRAEPLPVTGLSGGLLVTRDIDFIAYQRNTTTLHQDHIVCHEFGHLLAGHETVVMTGQDALRLLAPNIDPAVVRRMLGRSCSSERDEQEAEHIADLLMAHHISSSAPHAEWVLPETAPADVRNLLDTLGPGLD